MALRSSTNQAVVNWLTDRAAELASDAIELARIESHAAIPAGVARVASYVTGRLEPLGFSFRIHAQGPATPRPRWLEELLSPSVPYERLAPTWTGERMAKGGPHVLLLADLDTAFPSSLSAPARFDGSRLFGPGVADMKGGIVVLVAALRALDAVGLEAPAIKLVLAGDEQAGSLGSRPWIEAAADGAACCFCVECARDGGRLMVARAHIGVGHVVARGREAHTGSAHAAGINAIDALARLLIKIPALTDPQRAVYVTSTLVSGGRRRSVMPAHAEATLDVRTTDPIAWAATRSALEQLVAAAQARGDDVSLDLYDHRPGFGPNRETAMLLKAVQAIGIDIGVDAAAIASPAAGSSAFAGSRGVPTLDGMGPVGGNLMTPDEYIETESLVPRAALLALSINGAKSALGEGALTDSQTT